MNVDRMQTVARGVVAELEGQKLVSHLTMLRDSLQQLASNPADGGAQTNLSTARSQLKSQLPSAQSDGWSRADRQALEDLGLTDLLGVRLLDRIEAILTRNDLTPTVAAEEVAPIVAEIEQRLTALRDLIASYKALGLAPDASEEDCEVVVVIPRVEVDEELAKLGKEYVRLSNITGAFQELTTNTRVPVRVSSIASSDYSLFLSADTEWAAPLAKALERIADTFVRIDSIKTHVAELREEDDVPAEVLAGLEAHANDTMDAALAELSDELIDEYRPTAAGSARPQEFENALRAALNSLANRVDAGYGFDVRAPAPEPDPEPDEDGETPELGDEWTRRQAERLQIRDSGRRIRHFPAPAMRILELPENTGDSADIEDEELE